MYIFYPLYGLGNRMRVIDSAYRFCDTHHKKFRIYWKRDHVVNCPFNELFFPLDHLRESSSYKYIVFLHKLERHFGLVRSLMKALEWCHILKIFKEEQYQELRDFTNKGGAKFLFVIVESYSVFFKTEEDDFLRDLFILNDSMSKRLSNEIKSFKNNVIGVHIRRTDNKDSIERSPLELFIARMQEEIVKDPEVQFYVASDDPLVKEQLLHMFGAQRIIIPTGVIGRDSEEGIRQAVIEMYALSKTNRILGSYYSSFSEIASYIGGIKLTTLKS